MSRTRLSLLPLVAFLLWPSPASSHTMRTAHLEVVETGDLVVATLHTIYPDPNVVPHFPDRCVKSDEQIVPPATDHTRAFRLRCPAGLAGQTISIDGLGIISTEAVVRVERPGQGVLSRIVTPQEPHFALPQRQTLWRVGADYVRLGIAHILAGYDHLLFLLGLVLLVRRWQIVLLAESAFTLSHSISFTATALEIVRVSQPAAEAAIALSLVILACEIGDTAFSDRTLAWRAPLLSLVFGLVHGLGFAGGLREIGLPEGAIPTALIGFGLGVELGQLGFLVSLLALGWLAAKLSARSLPVMRTSGSYLVGTSGAFFLFQRLWICFG